MTIQAQMHSDNIGFNLGGASENGYGVKDQFCFNVQQKQQDHQFMQQVQQQHLQNLQQRNQNLCFQNIGLIQKTHNNQPSMAFSQSIATQMEKQRQEFDQFLSIQNDNLRMALLEKRNQQLSTMMKHYQSRAEILLKQKDEEIAKAIDRKLELENMVRGMEVESQTWQKVAKQNEEMVMSLNNTIEQLRENVFLWSNGVADDAESICDVINDRGEKTGENRGFPENKEQSMRKMGCRSCGSGNSCFIFLPCRHLGSCKACEPFLGSCPVCGMVKKNSIDALF